MLGFAVGFLVALMGMGLLWWLDARRRKQFIRHVADVAQTVRHGAYQARVINYIGKVDKRFVHAVNEMIQSLADRVQDLSEERDVLRHILHSMTTGVIYIGQSGRVRMMNEAAQLIVMRPLEHCIDDPYSTVIRHAGISAAVEQAMLYGTPWRSEIELRNHFTVEIQVIALNYDSTLRYGQRKPYSVLLLCTDVSQWRRLEQMRSDFVANVSHELKTPITSIRGFSETLLEGAVDDEAAHTFLGVIHEESVRMGNLVSDLLSLSKLEGANQGVHPHKVVFADVVDAAVQRLHSEIEKRQLNLIVAPFGQLVVWGDEEKLLQVLLNLVVNASHYTGSGGEIRISFEMVGDSVKVHVKDTGVGISPEHQARVFERFYRVNRDRSRATGGTGLGLAIAKHIVNAHGGEIGLTSELGKGSDFWFTLSRVQPNS
jgi:two-component system, OmpR family, phosphate regulon sensor histidine kinase PhoR